MEAFSNLFYQLEETSSTNEKLKLLENYFMHAPSQDAAWALFFLSGERIRRGVSSRDLAVYCLELTQIAPWLFEECHTAVGDTAETVSLLLPSHSQTLQISLSEVVEKKILPLVNKKEEEKKVAVFDLWKSLKREHCFILNKILTGNFRIGLSKQLAFRAFEKAFNVPKEQVAKAFTLGYPQDNFFELLQNPHEGNVPLPFYLASPLEKELESLGDPSLWHAEWKWDGIRGQLISNGEEVMIWSRGGEVITHQCPELVHPHIKNSSSFTLDGEILAYQNGKPMSFFDLQTRLGRKKPSKAVIEKAPLVFMAYDVMSYEGKDLRQLPFHERRMLLQKIVKEIDCPTVLLSEEVPFNNWKTLEDLKGTSKERGVEGFILKERQSPYLSGRIRGKWWKFKIAPMTVDAVLFYAQPGSGRRANLYTDYTFGVWKDGELVPLAKAYSGLTEKEIDELDHWIRRNTLEKFGPVRRVIPFQVFELAFENIQPSKRHKAGVALRFPRILRWRKDKTAEQGDQLEDVKKLLKA